MLNLLTVGTKFLCHMSQNSSYLLIFAVGPCPTSAANPLASAAAVDRWNRLTDRHHSTVV